MVGFLFQRSNKQAGMSGGQALTIGGRWNPDWIQISFHGLLIQNSTAEFTFWRMAFLNKFSFPHGKWATMRTVSQSTPLAGVHTYSVRRSQILLRRLKTDPSRFHRGHLNKSEVSFQVSQSFYSKGLVSMSLKGLSTRLGADVAEIGHKSLFMVRRFGITHLGN